MTLDQIATIAQGIIEHAGYCEVPSLSNPGTTHRVYVNSRLYSVSCDCKGSQCGNDCGHRLAVDRHYDGRRVQRERAEIRFLEAPRPTCGLCGQPTRGATICGRCIGW